MNSLACLYTLQEYMLLPNSCQLITPPYIHKHTTMLQLQHHTFINYSYVSSVFEKHSNTLQVRAECLYSQRLAGQRFWDRPSMLIVSISAVCWLIYSLGLTMSEERKNSKYHSTLSLHIETQTLYLHIFYSFIHGVIAELQSWQAC